MAEKVEIKSVEDMNNGIGKEMVSDYLDITQAMIQKFADATLDFQWIHLDPERVKREKPFGLETTIAHGYLIPCLAPYFLWELVSFPTAKMFTNYAMDKLSFKNPVKTGSKLRMKAKITEVKDLRRVVRFTIAIVFEVQGEDKPAATADVTYLVQF